MATRIWERYFDEFAEENGWRADSTKSSYKRDFESRIVPVLETMNVPLHVFNAENLRTYKWKFQKNYSWSFQRYRHMEYLFLIIYAKGAELHFYEDKLNVEIRKTLDGDLRNAKVIEKREAFFELKKSFSVEENVRIIKWLRELSDNLENHNPLDIGVAIMFTTGTRVNECVALMFSDFSKITSLKIPSVSISKSAKINSSDIKIGTKTRSGVRRIPVCDFLFNLVEKKRQLLISESIKKGISIFFAEEETKKKHIITNADGSDASSSDLSKRIKEVFNELGLLEHEQEFALDYDLEHQEEVESAGYDIVEISPTAYALRRNFATLITAAGLSGSEKQFIFGHVVEDDRRSYYNTPNRLESIYHKINRHPAFSLLNTGNVIYTDEELEFQAKEDSNYIVSICANEPFDALSFTLKINESDVEVEKVNYLASGSEVGKEVDIIKQLNMLYIASWENKGDKHA